MYRACNRKATRNQIKEFLAKQDTYTLHKKRNLKFPRNRYYVSNINDLFEMDLIDMQTLKKYNEGIAYVLILIDVFSKKIYHAALKTKSGIEVRDALEKILTFQKPISIRCDSGKEFLNKHVKSLMKRYNINFFVSQTPNFKCAIVERSLRTLKSRFWRYFTYKKTYKYYHILDRIIKAYNSTFNSSIGRAPNAVNDDNILDVYNYLYFGNGRYKALNLTNMRSSRFQVGDKVRITVDKTKFEKGFESTFSNEIFIIKSVVNRNPKVYKIVDLSGADILGRFYDDELQRVITSSQRLYDINKIIKTKRRGKHKTYFVSWKNYGPEFNSWVKESDLKLY